MLHLLLIVCMIHWLLTDRNMTIISALPVPRISVCYGTCPGAAQPGRPSVSSLGSSFNGVILRSIASMLPHLSIATLRQCKCQWLALLNMHELIEYGRYIVLSRAKTQQAMPVMSKPFLRVTCGQQFSRTAAWAGSVGGWDSVL